MAEHDHEPTEDVSAAPPPPAGPCMSWGQDSIHEWSCVLTAGHEGPHSGVDGAFTWTDDTRP